ncbi:hypothetical protein Ae406Ps2_3306 [Pseudonocardia sp. Ae406_Ps2]|nr:hypothetical protein Ae331Ps2_2618c [Pseudonocardia sp. Ae331_Ps2]OLM03306.1 hypothetical protein Ae406Ps2_3306 [Pseudonocardia sp. Ae406_Ps2]OLM11798.1 hypothetical protein Ae505Ps2_1923c [Pseudonocardia sp. Ae505_Ps2]OLM24871.1 hypothetical protein Ae706Ps2_3304 [Pseudonocardia sp. Ae706_Ps2]
MDLDALQREIGSATAVTTTDSREDDYGEYDDLAAKYNDEDDDPRR